MLLELEVVQLELEWKSSQLLLENLEDHLFCFTCSHNGTRALTRRSMPATWESNTEGDLESLSTYILREIGRHETLWLFGIAIVDQYLDVAITPPTA